MAINRVGSDIAAGLVDRGQRLAHHLGSAQIVTTHHADRPGNLDLEFRQQIQECRRRGVVAANERLQMTACQQRTNKAGSLLGAGGYTLAAGRTLTDNGAITGKLNVSGTLAGSGAVNDGLTVNAGGLVGGTSGTLTVTGAVVNNGAMRFTGGAVLNAGGASMFVNNGVIDLLSGGALLPANFVNGSSGVVLTGDLVRVKTISAAGAAVTLTIDSYTGHAYQLQRSVSFDSASFVNVGSPQNGTTGSTLTFTDPNPTGTKNFYRVLLNP